MKNYSLIIGIDISKLKLDVIGINYKSEIVNQHQTINNTKRTITSFFRKLISKYGKENILFSFENTGVYGYYLIFILEKMNLDYCNLSALDVNKSKGIRRGKSDKLDALIIAQYTLANSFRLDLSKHTELQLTKLKLLFSQREKVVKTIKNFNNNKEAEQFLPNEILKEFSKSNKSIINNLKKNLKLIEDQISQIIDDNISLKKDYDLIQSIPGVGPQTACYILIVTKGFTIFDNARKLACYAGVVPFPYQSGSSIKGKNKVSYLADKKLKTLLNLCAMNAKKYDHQLKLYFEKKVNEGKNKMLILNNIRNKLLHRIFAVVKRQQPYINTHSYAN